MLGGVADVLEAGRRAPGLGRRLPDRTHAQLVGLRAQAGVELLGRVGRQPDQQVGPDTAAHLGHRLVVLAHVDAVGPTLEREVGAVVEPEERIVLVADRAKASRRAQDRLVVGVLVAQLHHVHAAAQRGGQHVLGRRFDHEVKPRPPQALARVGGHGVHGY